MCFNFLHIKKTGIATTGCAIAQMSAFLNVQVDIKYYICNTGARKMYNVKFLDRFSENTQISNFMKIRPVESKLFDANGQTDRQTERKTKVTVAPCNFATNLKNTWTPAHGKF